MNIQRYEDSLHGSHIQKEKHLPTGKENDKQDERNILYSIHQRGKRKTLWYQSNWVTMEANSVPTNKERVTYKSKIFPYHALHRCLMTTVLPEVKVKPDETVSISWCDNIFINGNVGEVLIGDLGTFFSLLLSTFFSLLMSEIKIVI